jgi:fructose-1,6-bisphosphatase II / sedoheptulose-1,7-bisphosphatase
MDRSIIVVEDPLLDNDELEIERSLALALARVTERAAAAAARLRGRGDEMAADIAAARAMRAELQRLPIRGRIVVGEEELGDATTLVVGEELGAGDASLFEFAVAPLEGANLCAKDMPGAISVVAMAKAGSLLRTPNVYMDKIAIGPGFPPGLVDLDREPAENIAALARAKGVPESEITVCILDRPRHAELICKCRNAGARVRLISDGDVTGVIFTAQPAQTGVDMYLGRGGAPEGVLAAGALRCAGGQMQARLTREGHRGRGSGQKPLEPHKKYGIEELASGDVVVCASGVTDGPLLAGVQFGRGALTTETLVYHSSSATVRRIVAEHSPRWKLEGDDAHDPPSP